MSSRWRAVLVVGLVALLLLAVSTFTHGTAEFSCTDGIGGAPTATVTDVFGHNVMDDNGDPPIILPPAFEVINVHLVLHPGIYHVVVSDGTETTFFLLPGQHRLIDCGAVQ